VEPYQLIDLLDPDTVPYHLSEIQQNFRESQYFIIGNDILPV